MKICTQRLPADARLFIKCKDKVVFDDVVIAHNDGTVYNSGCLVRSRVYGMTPYEYTGSKFEASREVIDGILNPIGYRDLTIPDVRRDLPFNPKAKEKWDESEAELKAKEDGA